MSSLTFASAHQLARMIRDRRSAVEVFDAYLTQIAKHNSQLNAICTLDEDNARTRAKLADEALARGENWGALHGFPSRLKTFLKQPDSAPQQANSPQRLCASTGCNCCCEIAGAGLPSWEKPTWRNWLPIIKAQILCFHG